MAAHLLFGTAPDSRDTNEMDAWALSHALHDYRERLSDAARGSLQAYREAVRASNLPRARGYARCVRLDIALRRRVDRLLAQMAFLDQ